METFDLSHPTVRVTWVKQRADRAVLTFENVQKKAVLYFDLTQVNFIESLRDRESARFHLTCIGKVRDVEQVRQETDIEYGEFTGICQSALVGDRLVPAVRNFLLVLGVGDSEIEDIVEGK